MLKDQFAMATHEYSTCKYSVLVWVNKIPAAQEPSLLAASVEEEASSLLTPATATKHKHHDTLIITHKLVITSKADFVHL